MTTAELLQVQCCGAENVQKILRKIELQNKVWGLRYKVATLEEAAARTRHMRETYVGFAREASQRYDESRHQDRDALFCNTAFELVAFKHDGAEIAIEKELRKAKRSLKRSQKALYAFLGGDSDD